MHHTPVMINEVLSLIEAHPHSRLLDGTLGLGGYSLAILEHFPESSIIGIDRDEQALAIAREKLKPHASRFTALHAEFSTLKARPECHNTDVCVFDLGVSNMQLSIPERGFSFQNDGPLDMRMNPSSGPTAAEILRDSDAETLTRIFRDYGEERFARQIAQAIKHSLSPITTTSGLVNIILPPSASPAENGHTPSTQSLPGPQNLRQRRSRRTRTPPRLPAGNFSLRTNNFCGLSLPRGQSH